MKYQHVYIEGTTDIHPDRVIKLEGEMAGAVIRPDTRFWPEYLEYTGKVKPPCPPFGVWDEVAEAYFVDEKAKAAAELYATDSQLSRVEEDLIEIKLRLGIEVPESRKAKADDKKAKRAAYLAL